MPRDLLAIQHTDDLEAYLARIGSIFTTFADQDSGCLAYGVAVDGERWFVKTARTTRAVRSLRRARALHGRVQHPAIIPLRHAFDAADRPVLVYPWKNGETLYHPTRRAQPSRSDPRSPMARFRSLPLATVLNALDRILDAHRALAAAGYVAVDFYDGCILYDFAQNEVHLHDLDEYRPGPFTLRRDRLPGSTRFMAPEEHTRGATIDERTTVHALGRALRLLLDAGDTEAAWRATAPQLLVVRRATDPVPSRRHPSVEALVSDWRTVTGPRTPTQQARATGQETPPPP